MIHVNDHSPLLTNPEAAVYLRLCEPDDEPDEVAKAVRSVHKLVRDGKLRPVQPGQAYTFARAELDRYIEAATSEFKPKTVAH